MSTEISLIQTAEALRSLRGFIGPAQLECLGELLRSGEESQHFRQLILQLASVVANMPKTYEQEDKSHDAIVSLHYFVGGCDWHITEKDAGSADDEAEQFQSQSFGLADLGFGFPELGYISLPEILANGAELDLYWTPKTLAEIRKERAA